MQITGTEGAGLRIRSEPGQNSETVFLGEEEETFKVKDGPKQADGHTWWYVVAPYDETRAGWAAADFLAVVPRRNLTSHADTETRRSQQDLGDLVCKTAWRP